LSQKVGSLNGRPGPGKVGQNNAKTSTLVTSPTENPKAKPKKIFFQSQPEDLANTLLVRTAF